jgi:nucleotidyltransferase substrate binding protein (TIGR01987 family)
MENKLDISPLKKALDAFSKALSQSDKLEEEFYEVFRAAIIQNFEFSFELCWKFMRRWLEMDDLSAVERMHSKKDLFRLARERNLINDSEKWFTFLDARNRTSHIYDEEVAEEVYLVAKGFHFYFKAFVVELEKRI